MSGMSARRLLACLLLLLLVFQPAAAVTLCPHAMSSAASAEAGPAGAAQAEAPCVHGDMSAMQADAPAGDAQGDMAGDAPPQHSCCVSFVCGPGGVLPQAASPVAGQGRHERLAAMAAPQYISFVPEGLQRPPSFLA
jgi:hypothetical protein